MKGLVCKDLMTIGHELHRVLLFMLIFVLGMPILFAATSGEMEQVYSMPLTMCPVVGMVMINNAFGYDEKSGWMQYALTNPLSRMQYYHAKFLTHIVNVIIGCAVGLAVSTVLSAVTKQLTLLLLGKLLAQAGGMAVAFSLIGLWIIPLFLKFGVQKGAVMVMMVFIGIAALSTGLIVLGGESISDPFSTDLPLWTPVLLVALVLGSFITLYLLGRKWMMEKEF